MNNTILIIPKGKEYYTIKNYGIFIKAYKNNKSNWESLQDFKKFINNYINNFKA